MKITEIERAALQGILDSDYMDGAEGTEAVGKPVWTWSANPFGDKRKFSGAVSSLKRKGLVRSTDEGDDSVISITAEGLAALQPKTEELTGWEVAAIVQAVEARADLLHRDSVQALLEKLQNASHIKLSYRTAAEREALLDSVLDRRVEDIKAGKIKDGPALLAKHFKLR